MRDYRATQENIPDYFLHNPYSKDKKESFVISMLGRNITDLDFGRKYYLLNGTSYIAFKLLAIYFKGGSVSYLVDTPNGETIFNEGYYLNGGIFEERGDIIRYATKKDESAKIHPLVNVFNYIKRYQDLPTLDFCGECIGFTGFRVRNGVIEKTHLNFSSFWIDKDGLHYTFSQNIGVYDTFKECQDSVLDCLTDFNENTEDGGSISVRYFKIRTIDDVTRFFRYLFDTLGCNIHPDDDFNDVIDIRTEEPMFSKEDARRLNGYMDACFRVCTQYNIDIYAHAINVIC